MQLDRVLQTAQRESLAVSHRHAESLLHWHAGGPGFTSPKQVGARPLKSLHRTDTQKQTSGEFVFPGEGVTGHYVEPKRAWKRLLARAKVEGLHIHDLRRSLASFMANAGADVSLIQSALNHKDIKTTLTVYVRTARSAELTAREKAHDLIRKLADTDSGGKVVKMRRRR